MSADNWGECPRCKAKAEAETVARVQKANEAYGNVPAEEYKRLCLEAALPVKRNETFREDYEVGLYKDGKFRVDYGGGCAACGLEFSYKYEVKIAV